MAVRRGGRAQQLITAILEAIADGGPAILLDPVDFVHQEGAVAEDGIQREIDFGIMVAFVVVAVEGDQTQPIIPRRGVDVESGGIPGGGNLGVLDGVVHAVGTVQRPASGCG